MCSFSQTTYPKLVNDSLIVITPIQLKSTNLIFLEHSKFKKQLKEFDTQLHIYNNLLNEYAKSDTLYKIQIDNMQEGLIKNKYVIREQMKQIDKLNKKKNSLRKLSIGGFGISAVLLIILLI